MTIQEIIKNTTIHYEWCIENLPKDKPLEFCIDNFVHHGICFFWHHFFEYEINEEFINKYTKGLEYLCKKPFDVETFEEMLLSLRTRHKRLLEMADYKE